MSAPPDRGAIERLVEEALELAERGRFRVEPNPTVGAIVLDAGGAIVARGWHRAFGEPHAESNALEEAGERARGGTLIVTLEPCAHTGKKTPPCVPAVVAAGVSRVVAGCEDPNPATSGRAAAAFAAAGIAYEVGVRRERCRSAIDRYVRHLESDRPWGIAKWAVSLDGRVADSRGVSRWISNSRSRDEVSALRGAVDAIVVGRETVVRDDPSLTSRSPGRSAALRVVFDSHVRIPTTARVVATAREIPTLIVAVRDVDPTRRLAVEAAGARIAEVAAGPDGRVDVAEAFRELRRRGVRRVLIEAGGALQAACLRADVVDQVAAFVAPVVIGGEGSTPFDGAGWDIANAPRLESVRVTALEGDALVEGYWPVGTA